MATRITVNTLELNTGDVVLTHTMRVLLGGRGERFDPSTKRTVAWFAGTVLNADEVDPALVPLSFRTKEGYAPGTHWQIQGNDLARWIVEVAS